MPKSCKKRKIRKLKRSERFSDLEMVEVHPDGRKSARSYMERMSDFFKRISPFGSVHTENQTCSNNNNNPNKYFSVIGRGSEIYYSDEKDSIDKEKRFKKARREGQIEKDIFQAYQDIGRLKDDTENGISQTETRGYYIYDLDFLSSVLIEMLNNEPYFQEMPYRKCKDAKTTPQSADDKDSVEPEDVIYAVGETVTTGKFNLEVLKILGEGSQATIYEIAKDSASYAAKVSKKPSYTKYLLQEYEILSSLDHGHILTVHDEIPKGFTMDILPNDLNAHLRRRYDPNALKLPLRDPITAGILKAVSYLHSKGIAHLDIKPANILLTANREPKLADFGLALRIHDENGQLKSLKGIRGSLPYLSPEVLTRRPDNIMTAIDAWAVGVLMYTVFTGGCLPFGNKSVHDIYQHQMTGPVALPQKMIAWMRIDATYANYFCVIVHLLTLEPERRPSVESALTMFGRVT